MCFSVRCCRFATALLRAILRVPGPARRHGALGRRDPSAVEEVEVSVDLAATIGQARRHFQQSLQKLTGFPLWSATVEGKPVRLEPQDQRARRAGLDGRPVAPTVKRWRGSSSSTSTPCHSRSAHRRRTDRSAAPQRRDRRQARGVVGRIARRGRRPVIAARADADEPCRPNFDGYLGHGWRLADPRRRRRRRRHADADVADCTRGFHGHAECGRNGDLGHVDRRCDPTSRGLHARRERRLDGEVGGKIVFSKLAPAPLVSAARGYAVKRLRQVARDDAPLRSRSGTLAPRAPLCCGRRHDARMVRGHFAPGRVLTQSASTLSTKHGDVL